MSIPQPAASVPFDARPLTEPVDSQAVREHAQLMKAATASTQNTATVVVFAIVIIVALLTLVPAILGMVLVFVRAPLGEQGALSALGAVLPLGLLTAAGVGVFLAVRAFLRKRDVTRYRLHRFAEANGMHYHPVSLNPPLPGMIFHLGRSRRADDIVRGTEPRFAEFGNYQYTVGSGKNSTTYKWGYVAIKLDVPLPHIVLDALSNNGLFGASNLPTSFRRDQRLELEGDFNQHFALYCPEGYEADALYLFTPDIMARFIDHAAAMDVEIVDDWLFLYARRDFSTLDPATWAWLFSAVAALLAKFEQWARWRDERLRLAPLRTGAASGLPFAAPTAVLTPPPGVAPEGQRLRQRFSWVVAIPIVGVIVWVVLQVLGGILRAL